MLECIANLFDMHANNGIIVWTTNYCRNLSDLAAFFSSANWRDTLLHIICLTESRVYTITNVIVSFNSIQFLRVFFSLSLCLFYMYAFVCACVFCCPSVCLCMSLRALKKEHLLIYSFDKWCRWYFNKMCCYQKFITFYLRRWMLSKLVAINSTWSLLLLPFPMQFPNVMYIYVFMDGSCGF